MDNDPSQQSKAAAKALEDIEAELLEIPSRSPDMDCIENVFNLVKCFLKEEAIALNITRECFEEFKQQVLTAFDSIPVAVIDNITLRMNKGIEAILTCKGHRTKYYFKKKLVKQYLSFYIFNFQASQLYSKTMQKYSTCL